MVPDIYYTQRLRKRVSRIREMLVVDELHTKAGERKGRAVRAKVHKNYRMQEDDICMPTAIWPDCQRCPFSIV